LRNSCSKSVEGIQRWASQHQMIPEQLDPLAGQIRDAYVQERRMLFPHYHVNTARHNEHFWRKVAILVTELHADPLVYVHLAFEQYGPRTYAEALLNTNLGFLYRSSNVDQNMQDSIALDLSLYDERLSQRLSEGRKTLTELLRDSTICPFDLFVWCVAVKMGLQDVAKEYEASAKHILLRPAYRTVYSQAFPEVFNVST